MLWQAAKVALYRMSRTVENEWQGTRVLDRVTSLRFVARTTR